MSTKKQGDSGLGLEAQRDITEAYLPADAEVMGEYTEVHLLVMRNSAMGDVAMLPHALRALGEACPGMKITVATRPLFKPFFEGLEVDFLEVDTKGRHHSLAGMWRLAREAREKGVNAFADCHGVLRSKAFRLAMWLHGIPVAHIRKGRGEKARFIRQHSDGEWLKHTVDRYCDVFRRLGLPVGKPQPAPRASRPSPLGEKQGVWVGFAPFSAQKGKTYPEDLSRAVVALLAERYDRVFIHGGGGHEAEFAREMEQKHERVTALAGRVKLGGELDLIANLDCVVSMDSLVMHMASLVGTPVVSVWGATHPGLGFLGYGCDPEGVLQGDLDCRPCSVYGGKKCRYGDHRCMRAVSPEMILEKVGEMIAKNRK